MNRTLTHVLVERERLLASCAQQRDAVATSCRALAGPAAVLDRVVSGGRYLVGHPIAVAGTIGILVALRGRSLLNLAMRGIGLWRVVRRVRSLMQFVRR